jgi:hypothetical protein
MKFQNFGLLLFIGDSYHIILSNDCDLFYVILLLANYLVKDFTFLKKV